MRTSPPVYRIHPGLAVARLGDSPDEFCLAPDKPASLPIECDSEGNPLMSPDGTAELTVKKFKDNQGRIKRQAARFRIYVYDDDSPSGRPLALGDPIEGGGNRGLLIDIQWRVYLANKKAAWYEFDQLEGEHGYSSTHKRRNAAVTDPEARQRLIIDPGPRIVNATTNRRAHFSREDSGLYSPTFPPELTPHSIDTLGELLTDRQGRLLVLGGHGRSGSYRQGFGEPRIETYANNDGWFDDTSDGPVMARLVMHSTEVDAIRYVDVEYPAWVIAAYPRYVPEILDMVTADDVIYDMAIRDFAWRTDLYGEAGTFDNPRPVDRSDIAGLVLWQNGRMQWNPDFKPWFWRDIWPILFRADEMSYLTNVLSQSNFPHNQSARGNFDPDKLGAPPVVNQKAVERLEQSAAERNQNGGLFLEAIEPGLLLFDDRFVPGEHPLAKALAGPEDTAGDGLRKQLREAAGRYASAVLPDGPAGDPAGYLRAWRRTDDSGEHAEAAKSFRQDVFRIVHGFVEDAAGKKHTATLLLARRMERREAEPPASDRASGLSIEELIERGISGFLNGSLLGAAYSKALADSTTDYFRSYRTFLFDLIRLPGEENVFRLYGNPGNRTSNLPLMPLLAGDNPISNTVPSKFLKLTDFQIYLLRQWAHGKFINEVSNGWVKNVNPWQPFANWKITSAQELDRSVLMSVLGGAFCPGGEVCWIVRNPSAYREPYRIKADPDFYTFNQTAAQANAKSNVSPLDYVSDISALLNQDTDFEQGLQPGDLTKYGAIPWQSDFNECTTQDVDITYEQWNVIDSSNADDPWMVQQQQVWETLWWPAHRPLQTYEVTGVQGGQPVLKYLNWARGVPQTNAGDLKMVTEWSKLGFVVRNPYLTSEQLNAPSPDNKYISIERNDPE